eukprot:2777848-Rhodomonas_salina.1
MLTLYNEFVVAPGSAAAERLQKWKLYTDTWAFQGCPAVLCNQYKGGKGYPSIAYEVVCDHNLFILGTTCSFSGTTNDKTILLYDLFIEEVKRGARYVNLEFKLMWADCSWTTHKGCPMLHSSDADDHRFSQQIEAVCKDIERTFGVLKGRFRIPKVPVLLHNQDKVDHVFWTCAILHNMIRKFNFQKRWEADVDWTA